MVVTHSRMSRNMARHEILSFPPCAQMTHALMITSWLKMAEPAVTPMTWLGLHRELAGEADDELGEGGAHGEDRGAGDSVRDPVLGDGYSREVEALGLTDDARRDGNRREKPSPARMVQSFELLRDVWYHVPA